MPEGAGIVQTRLLVVRQLAARIAPLDAAIKEVTAAIQQRVAATETRLTELPGVGAVVAARLLGELNQSSDENYMYYATNYVDFT